MDEITIIEIKHRVTGALIFEHDCDENTIAITLEAALDAHANLRGADLSGAHLCGAENISDSHAILAEIAVRFDASLAPVASMIAGEMIGCWKQYTVIIMEIFGVDTMRKLSDAWTQCESWGVTERLTEYGWPTGTDDGVTL